MKKVLVLFGPDESLKKKMQDILPEHAFIYEDYVSVKNISCDELKETEAVIGNISPEMISCCPDLKWIQLFSAGTDGYTPDIINDITLTNATGIYGHAIAEYMTAGVFELFKKMHLYRDSQKSGQWTDLGQVRSVRGSVVLVVGLGDIGSQFAQRMKALGCRIIGVRRTLRALPDYADEVVLSEDLDDVLPLADVVALSVPGNESTRNLLSRERIAKMKKDAVLINVGRGISVDTQALCDALRNNELAGAVLDVTDPEPLPQDHMLWQLENAVITPHVSGRLRGMPETYEYFTELCLENLSRYKRKEELLCVVDMQTGYKKSQDSEA